MTHRRPEPDALSEEYHDQEWGDEYSWLPTAALIAGGFLWGLILGAALATWLT